MASPGFTFSLSIYYSFPGGNKVKSVLFLVNMNGSTRRIPGMPFFGRKERDEDLLLFKELHKREKDRIVSLLQPVSDEFEPSIISLGNNNGLYRISSGKKGSGYDSFGENGKNEYDWLKTPPATPLFPSLEMEANSSELVVQREIPILQPLSRFAGNLEAVKENNGKPKSLPSKPKMPARSVTPCQRQSISSIQTKNIKAPPVLNPKAHFTSDSIKQTNMITDTANRTQEKETRTNFLASNLSKNIIPESKQRPRSSRGVSPSVRSTIPGQIPGFSNETPPNLKTDRSTSATRGRSSGINLIASVNQKPEPITMPRRQSCSPSVARGRIDSKANLTIPKGKIQTGNGAQIFGSKMVDKVMNARKQCAEERQANPKPEAITTVTNERGYNLARKTSLDLALKYTEMKRDRIGSRPGGFDRGRSSTRD